MIPSAREAVVAAIVVLAVTLPKEKSVVKAAAVTEAALASAAAWARFWVTIPPVTRKSLLRLELSHVAVGSTVSVPETSAFCRVVAVSPGPNATLPVMWALLRITLPPLIPKTPNCRAKPRSITPLLWIPSLFVSR